MCEPCAEQRKEDELASGIRENHVTQLVLYYTHVSYMGGLHTGTAETDGLKKQLNRNYE